MNADQRARALRLADALTAPMGEAGKTGYATQHEAADLLRELAAEPERVPLSKLYIASAWRSAQECANGNVAAMVEHFARHIEHAHGIV